MSDKKPVWSFNPQLPTVTGFLGAVTFTAMILLIENSSHFECPKLLITLSGTTSFLLIVATMGGATDQRNSPTIKKQFKNLIKFCLAVGYIGLLALIPLIIWSFTQKGAIVLGIFEIIIYVIYSKYAPDEVQDPTIH